MGANGIKSGILPNESKEAMQPETRQQSRESMKAEIPHFTDTPEIQHFAIEKADKNDNVYGVKWGNLVLEYLKTAYSGKRTEEEVVLWGAAYKVLKRREVTAFYDADGNTLFDVENKRLEKEYEWVMNENTRIISDDAVHAENSGDRDTGHETPKQEDAGNTDDMEGVPEDKGIEPEGGRKPRPEKAEKYSGIDGAIAKLQEELKTAKPKEFAEPVIEYLTERCRESESLSADICQNHKTWKKCYDYIVENAKKKLNNVSGPVRNDTVFEWAEDYYHKDDKAEEERKAKEKAERIEKQKKEAAERKAKAKEKPAEPIAPKKEEKPKELPKQKKSSRDMDGQLDMFSMMGM